MHPHIVMNEDMCVKITFQGKLFTTLITFKVSDASVFTKFFFQYIGFEANPVQPTTEKEVNTLVSEAANAGSVETSLPRKLMIEPQAVVPQL